MPGIDPSIVVHEIKTYPMAKPIRKNLRQVHPWKDATIKAEIEKLLKVGFIYPIPLTEWVSNVVPVNKKQGTIRFYIDFKDLNKLVPRTTFLLHTSIRLSTTVLEVSYSHLWMASLAIIRLRYYPPISTRRHSFSHGESLHIKSYLLA